MSDVERMTDAIWFDDLAAVESLIRAGADVNAVDDDHLPPLCQAIEHQRIEIIRRLIAAGAAVNHDTGDGWTPLVHAIDSESDWASQLGVPPDDVPTKLLELLLASGAEPTARAFELATIYGNRKALSQMEQARRIEPEVTLDPPG